MSREKKQAAVRILVLIGAFMLMLSGFVPLLLGAGAADPAANGVELSAAGATPRKVEDTTEKAIVRDYVAAWKALNAALENNDPGALNAGFVGIARQKFAAKVASQSKAGAQVRYVSRGHKLEAVFYSPEGSAMQLRDTAELELQLVEDGKVIHSEPVQARFVALMTVADGRWKVRVLEEVQAF